MEVEAGEAGVVSLLYTVNDTKVNSEGRAENEQIQDMQHQSAMKPGNVNSSTRGGSQLNFVLNIDMTLSFVNQGAGARMTSSEAESAKDFLA